MEGLQENLLSELVHLYAVRYFTISAMSILVYDTLLTLPDEIHYAWMPLLIRLLRSLRCGRSYESSRLSPSALPRILLLLTRYTMLAISGVYLALLIPPFALSTNQCRLAIPVIFSLDVLMETVGSAVVLHRLYCLWDFGSRGSCALLGCFLVAKTLSISFAFAMIGITTNEVIYLSFGDIRVCSTQSAPRLGLGAWIPAAAFDIFTFILLLLNALSRPRTESQRLLNILYKDGIIFFLTTIVMRMINVVFVAFAPPSLFYIGFMVSGMIVTTASSRSLLSLFYIDEKATVDGYDNYSDGCNYCKGCHNCDGNNSKNMELVAVRSFLR